MTHEEENKSSKDTKNKKISEKSASTTDKLSVGSKSDNKGNLGDGNKIKGNINIEKDTNIENNVKEDTNVVSFAKEAQRIKSEAEKTSSEAEKINSKKIEKEKIVKKTKSIKKRVIKKKVAKKKLAKKNFQKKTVKKPTNKTSKHKINKQGDKMSNNKNNYVNEWAKNWMNNDWMKQAFDNNAAQQTSKFFDNALNNQTAETQNYGSQAMNFFNDSFAKMAKYSSGAGQNLDWGNNTEKASAEITDINKENSKACVEFSQALAEAISNINKEINNIINNNVAENSSVVKKSLNCKDVAELLQLQNKLLKINVENFTQESVRLSELAFKSLGSAAEPINQRLAEIGIKIATPTAA